MLFVYMKCRFSLSYRDLEETASIRGAVIDRKRNILTFIVIINAYIIWQLVKLGTYDKYLILPYFLWICFALYLNAVIVVIN